MSNIAIVSCAQSMGPYILKIEPLREKCKAKEAYLPCSSGLLLSSRTAQARRSRLTEAFLAAAAAQHVRGSVLSGLEAQKATST